MAYDSRRPLKTRQRDVIFGTEEAIHVCPACLEQGGHSVLEIFSFFMAANCPSDHMRQRLILMRRRACFF